MRVLVTGSGGLVGSALVPALTASGHQIVRLVRRSPGPWEIQWDPAAGRIDAAALENLDAVVHLAGERIDGLWTQAKKARIRDSRVKGTRLLSEALADRRQPPRVLVCASAIGYYGDRGDELLTEDSAPGAGFLAQVCQQWEAAAGPAEEKGIRVARLRLGMILSPAEGALKRMLPLFKAGMGGPLGSGRQYWSWIAIDDVVGAIEHALATDRLSGPVNGVAPHPVTNEEFVRTLGQVLGRPALLHTPAFALRLALGEMADELLLSSVRAQPARLQETGYAFGYPELEGALRHLLGA